MERCLFHILFSHGNTPICTRHIGKKNIDILLACLKLIENLGDPMHPFWLRNSVVYNQLRSVFFRPFTYENYITSPRRLGRPAYAIFAHLVNLSLNLLFAGRRYSSRSRPNGGICLQLDTMCMRRVTLPRCHVAPFRTTYTSSVGYERSDSVRSSVDGLLGRNLLILSCA